MILTVLVPNDFVSFLFLGQKQICPSLFLLLEHKEASIGLPAAVWERNLKGFAHVSSRPETGFPSQIPREAPTGMSDQTVHCLKVQILCHLLRIRYAICFVAFWKIFPLIYCSLKGLTRELSGRNI